MVAVHRCEATGPSPLQPGHPGTCSMGVVGGAILEQMGVGGHSPSSEMHLNQISSPSAMSLGVLGKVLASGF